MRGADADGAGWFPSTGGTIARLAYAKAKTAGLALQPLVAQAGLSLQQIEDPRARLSVRGQIKFLNAVADALHDDLLGFHLAQDAEQRETGVLYYVLASSETVAIALQRGARYSAIVNEGIVPKYIDGNDFGLSFRYVGVSRQLDRHQIEYWVTWLVRICRLLTGLRAVPSRLRFAHSREHGRAEFAEFLGCEPEFGSTVDELLFAAEVKHQPVVSADPYLNRLAIAYCEQAVSRRRRGAGSFRFRVENTVAPLLPHGGIKAADIALRLGVSQRTFARRLAMEGLSFSGLLEQLRSELAVRYLADPELTISQIAWFLGYQEVGAFSHAFRRWTGKTPRRARADLAASA